MNMFKSKQQEEIYRLLTEERLTAKAIANRRQTSLKAVYKIIKKLKEQGFLSNNFKGFKKDDPTFEPVPKKCTTDTPQKIRVHGLQFLIKIITNSQKYYEIQKKSNQLVYDGNTLLLHASSIQIFIGHSFFSSSLDKSLSDCNQYLSKLLKRLEGEFHIILLKSRYQNIKRLRCHVAETKNELSEDLEYKGEKLRIRTTEDGKIWLSIDNSFNLHECETQHRETSISDMYVLKDHFNDIRSHPEDPTPSEKYKMIRHNSETINLLIKNVNILTTNFDKMIYLLKPKEEPSPTKDDKSQANYFG